MILQNHGSLITGSISGGYSLFSRITRDILKIAGRFLSSHALSGITNLSQPIAFTSTQKLFALLWEQPAVNMQELFPKRTAIRHVKNASDSGCIFFLFVFGETVFVDDQLMDNICCRRRNFERMVFVGDMNRVVFDILPRLKPWDSKVTNASCPLARDLWKLLLLDNAPPSLYFRLLPFLRKGCAALLRGCSSPRYGRDRDVFRISGNPMRGCARP